MEFHPVSRVHRAFASSDLCFFLMSVKKSPMQTLLLFPRTYLAASSPPSILDGVAGPEIAVLPLHLGDLGVGESQFDQSSSSSSMIKMPQACTGSMFSAWLN